MREVPPFELGIPTRPMRAFRGKALAPGRDGRIRPLVGAFEVVSAAQLSPSCVPQARLNDVETLSPDRHLRHRPSTAFSAERRRRNRANPTIRKESRPAIATRPRFHLEARYLEARYLEAAIATCRSVDQIRGQRKRSRP
jgi:hypothetical protein